MVHVVNMVWQQLNHHKMSMLLPPIDTLPAYALQLVFQLQQSLYKFDFVIVMYLLSLPYRKYSYISELG